MQSHDPLSLALSPPAGEREASRYLASGSDDNQSLHKLACHHGIQLSYTDAAGEIQIVGDETIRALLGALGAEVTSERSIQRALQGAEQASAQKIIEPVYVVWGKNNLSIRLRSFATRLRAWLRLENGATIHLPKPAADGQLHLPNFSSGYHELQIELGGRFHSALIICAPTKAYSPRGPQRQWGVFVPLYALHSQQSWGAGDFRDCGDFANWLDSVGGNVLSLLPLMSAFLDKPFDPSPYAPASRLFWNEFFLHIPDLQELVTCVEARKLVESRRFQTKIAGFQKQRLIDYRDQMRLKRSVLEKLAQFFFSRPSERRTEFERFLKSRPEVRQYARFRAVTERLGSGWRQWPDRLKRGDIQTRDSNPQSEQYHMYAQWCAQQQVDQLRSPSPGLYLDLPLGVHADGFDSWREPEIFVGGASGGAPPDLFFSKGQDWGFSPLDPQKLRQSRYRYYIDVVRFAMRHTGLLRLDHVMGLHRLYWVPKGFPPSGGAYVSYPAKELYAILCLESHRHKTVLIGENLGTVPSEVNQALDQHGLSQMYVVQYEQRADDVEVLPPPPKNSAASMNTHDMPPFAAHWKRLDVRDRAALGLLTPAQVETENRRRLKCNRALLRFLTRKGFLKGSSPRGGNRSVDVLRACLRFLSQSEAELVLVNLEDLLGEMNAQNTPGTFRQRPNWRKKTRLSLEEIESSAECRAVLAEIAALRQATSKSS
jgi:4-alpha-glucanotransferase